MKKLYTVLAALAFSAGVWAQTITTFDYTGAVQFFTVPAGVTEIDVEVIAAQGGDASGTTIGWSGGVMAREGGRGGRVTCTIPVTGGETLEIYVGGQGDMVIGGFNGGGNPASCSGTEVIAAGGGGGSDIRQGGSALGDRVVIAGGGGGASGSSNATYSSPDYSGAGGGLAGADATTGGTSGLCTPGAGGTASVGGGGGDNSCWCSGSLVAGDGVLGAGGDGLCAPSGLSTCSCSGTGCTTGGGGGGGYYGGGAGICFAGGGGGSSYTDAGATSVVHDQGYQDGNGQIIITVLCNPIAVTVTDDTLCDGDMVTLDGTGAGTITWDGGVTNGVAFTPSVGTNTYTSSSTDPDDCAWVQVIFVGDIPTVDGGADVTVCEGEMVTLAASGATDYAWDGGVTDGVAFTPPGGLTTYTVTGTVDSTGCENTDMVDVTATVVDVAITATGTSLVADQAGATYQWLDCPGLTPIAGETNQTFTPSADGSYACAIAVGTCEDTTACQGVTVGIDKLFEDLGLNVYPIPASDNITIELAEGNGSFSLVSVSGETLLQRQISKGKTLIEVGNYSSGVYIMSFENESGIYTSQLIIE